MKQRYSNIPIYAISPFTRSNTAAAAAAAVAKTAKKEDAMPHWATYNTEHSAIQLAAAPCFRCKLRKHRENICTNFLNKRSKIQIK